MDGLFCREEDSDQNTYVPAYVHGAISADGEWNVWQRDMPVKLSDRDVTKWDYEKGDTVVIIGGRSRNSRIIKLTGDSSFVAIQRKIIYSGLVCDQNGIEDEDGRCQAFEYLKSLNYDVGSAGLKDFRRPSVPSEGGKNDAEALQRRAETKGIKPLSHQEQLHVANRLLQRQGWSGAMNWFREQYGEQFDQEQTRTILRCVSEKYDDLPDPPSMNVRVQEL